MRRTFTSLAGLLCGMGPAAIVAVLFGTAGSTAASIRVGSNPETYLVTFHLTASSSDEVAGLQWRTNYTSATGEFRGSNATVSCTSPTTGLFEPQDVDATRMLTLAVLTYRGYPPPAELATCVFDGFTDDPPLPGDFLITIEDQTDEDGFPITSTIVVTVSSGVSQCSNGVPDTGEQCDDGNSLNTDACTNACRTARCGDGFVWAGFEECDDGNTVDGDSCTNTCQPEGTPSLHCTMVFTLPDDATLGSLQWNTDYSDAPGFIPGAGNDIECAGLVVGVLSAFFDEDADRAFNSGLASVNGFDGPTDLAECAFEASAAPDAGDFTIRVDVADDQFGFAVVPQPQVEIASITCDGFPARCGNGEVEDPEQCDDGNAINTDACLNSCLFASCGDGFVRSGVEECDDANSLDGDGCSSLCETQRLCGDATDDGTLFASDALRILQRAVGRDVECPTWVCDVDGTNGIGASDALRLLRRSVNLPVTLSCGDPSAIFLRITSSTTLGSLQLNVGYQAVAGEIDGSGGSVDCQTLQPDVQAAFNDTPERVLSASFVSLAGIQGPAAIARCGFTPDANVDPEDFAVTVLDAKDTAGNTVAKPVVKVIPD